MSSSTSGIPTGAADAAGTPVWDDLILVGFVVRAQGNRGEVAVHAQTDFPDVRFRAGADLWLRTAGGTPERRRIAEARMHAGRPVLRFDGVESISGAEALAGAELRIGPAEQDPLPPGSYYHHELIGCEVACRDGRRVGLVTAVEGGLGVPRLVVRGAGGEVLIPLALDICPEIDVAARRIVVTPPDGLLELNGAWQSADPAP